MKLLVINPFATEAYDETIAGVCNRVKRSDTEITVEHLSKGLPFIRHGYFKALIIPEIVERCITAEQEGYDGVFVSCCFEPGVREAREVVDIPVVGGSAPPALIARQLGQKFGFITDTHLADVLTYDVFKEQKLDVECVDIRSVELGIEQIRNDPATNNERVIEVARKLVQDGADTIVLGCTVLSAYFDYKNIPEDLADIPFLDANVGALKTLEALADMNKLAGITVSRKIYAKPQDIEPEAFIKIRKIHGLID